MNLYTPSYGDQPIADFEYDKVDMRNFPQQNKQEKKQVAQKLSQDGKKWKNAEFREEMIYRDSTSEAVVVKIRRDDKPDWFVYHVIYRTVTVTVQCNAGSTEEIEDVIDNLIERHR